MTRKILKLFVFDEVLSIICRHISILAGSFVRVHSLFVLSLPHLPGLKWILLFSFLFLEFISKLRPSGHGKGAASSLSGSSTSGHDRFIVPLPPTRIELADRMTILAISRHLFGFALGIHVVVDLSTVVVKDIFLIEFGGVVTSVLILSWISISIVRNILWSILASVFLD